VTREAQGVPGAFQIVIFYLKYTIQEKNCPVVKNVISSRCFLEQSNKNNQKQHAC
jgi:hypothetical protein